MIECRAMLEVEVVSVFWCFVVWSVVTDLFIICYKLCFIF